MICFFYLLVSSSVINAYAYRDAMRAEAQKAKDHARELKDSIRPYRYRYPDNWSYGTVYHSSYPTWSFYDVFEDDTVIPSSSGNFIPGTNFV